METKKQDEKWSERRSEILNRDNFTCQNCHTFNPQLGQVEIYRKDNMSLELHSYESNPATSTYRISSTATGLTITLEFHNSWLVLPILQVHHKRYIENRDVWEYDDSDLVTLCKECHSVIHENVSIPIFDESGALKSKRKYLPTDKGSGERYNASPWNFVKFSYEFDGKSEYKREYAISDIHPTLSFFLSEFTYSDLSNEIVEDNSVIAHKMYEDFVARYLPLYSRDKMNS